MTNPITKQPDHWLACVVIVLISIGIDFYGHACGFLTTPDSLQYLSAAKSFRESGKFLNVDGSYYSYWGALFPVILSFFNDPQSALIWINVVCKIVIVIALFQLVHSFINDSILRIVFVIVSMIGVHMTLISVFVWSELIFFTFIVWNLYFALYLKKGASSYYGFLITGFLACLQRDAGFFLISGVCLWLLLDNATTLKTKIVQSTSCFVVCISGLVAWRFYIHLVMSQVSNFYDYSFFLHSAANAQSVLSTFGKMLLPLNGTLGIATAILFFVLLFGSFLKSTRNIQLLAIIISIYTLGFIAFPWQLDVNEMDRYFSVIVPLIFLFILSMIGEQMQSLTRTKRILIYFLIGVWLCYPLMRTYKNVQLWHEQSCALSNVSK